MQRVRRAHQLLPNDSVKHYELDVEGYHTPLTATDIAEHFYAGVLRKSDPCREIGQKHWRTIDELFPLLKYDSIGASIAPGRARIQTSTPVESDIDDHQERPITSSVKAGWICVGLGLAVAWFFPLGNVFFSVAIVAAVVAMCTHQVNRGLILLVSAFCGILFSVLAFFVLVVGTIGVVAAPAIKKANGDLKRMQAAEARARDQSNASLQQQMQAPVISVPFTQSNYRAPTQSRQQSQAIAQAQAAALQEENDRRRTQEIVRQAEQQRDSLDAKQKRIEQLQQSIDWYDHAAQDARFHGNDSKALDQVRERLLREKWDLQR